MTNGDQARRLRRREFLSIAAAASAGVIVLGPQAWAARAARGDASRKRLVVVFLRGAVDGLNVVVPYGESAYYDARPTIAIPQNTVIDLDGFFGLHPSFASIA